MPVNVHCTQCAADLLVDDGFKGGVCRCSSCGTLLSVPSDPKAPLDSASPQRRKRPANPNADPTLHRDNQHELKQRTGVFPALTELIGSSSGLQGVRQQPPARPTDPSESALGLSPPSPMDALVAPTFDLPPSPTLDAPARKPRPAAQRPSPVGPLPAPAPAQQPADSHRMLLVMLAVGGLLIVAALAVVIHLFRPLPENRPPVVPPTSAPAPLPPSPVTEPSTPVATAPAPLPATTMEPAPATEAAPATLPAPLPAPVPATLPSMDSPPATAPVPELAPLPLPIPPTSPAATLPNAAPAETLTPPQ